ncbi:MAG TPA: outer membrane beta-barrel domain-containing protein [Polyangia bacterium]|nr:outer membrane beta-barrel domain-containing protein [Polyangia bacterium]
MLRAALAFAVLYGLFNGTPAVAAPPMGGSEPSNPFEDRGDDASGDAGNEPASTSSDAGSGDADADADVAEESAESALHGLACLEGDATGGRRKGVQRRDFLKRHRFELSGLGGFYASDALSSTYSWGGALAFYPSEDFGLEVLLTRTPMRFRLEQPFTAFDQQTHFQASVAWQGIVSLLWSPIHAKLKFSETTILHGDLFVVAGAGRTADPTVQGLTWEAGAGAKIYFNRFFGFRLDVRDFVVPQEVLGRGRITNNVTVLAGLSLWLG